MTQAFQFDIERLLSPISAEHPAGKYDSGASQLPGGKSAPGPDDTSLRYEGTYKKISEARQEDDASLPQGVWKTELRKAQWKTVEALCVEAIETKSKDLQIAAWLTEAWLKLYGFSGAAKGLELMLKLCESFWDDLHPAIEDGDLEYRMAPLAWINEKLSISLKLRPITDPDAQGEKPCCWAEWENASRLDNLGQRPGGVKTIPDNAVTTAKFQQSVMLTPTWYFRTLRLDIGEMLEACAQLETFVDKKAGKKAPGFMQFRAVGESIGTFADSILKQRNDPGEAPAPIGQVQVTHDFSADHKTAAVLPIPSRIRDRADAYYLLAEAADFLARTEPHSPAPYLVRRAIAWGAMSLDELLPELVRDSAELTEIFRLLQIGRRAAGPT